MIITNHNLELIENDTLLQHRVFSLWEKKAKKIYNELHSKYPKMDYREYQPQFAAMYALRDYNICAGGCGLGKTIIIGILIAIIYEELKRPGQIQIAAPTWLSASSRWFTDLEKIEKLKGKIEIIKSEKQIYNSTAPIWIYTIDFPARKIKSGKRIVTLLTKRYKPNFLVVDEVHLIQSGRVRYTVWSDLRNVTKRFIVLSGTLSDGRLLQIFNTCKLVYGKIFPYDEKRFIKTFKIKSKVQTNYISGSVEQESVTPRYLQCLALDQVPIYSLLSRQFIHRIRLDNPSIRDCVSLPEQVNEIIELIPSNSHQNVYKSLVKEHRKTLIELARREHGIKALELLRLLQRCSNNEEGEQVKLEQIKLITGRRNKTIIFCNYIDSARAVTASMKKEWGDKRVLRLYAKDEKEKPKVLQERKRVELLSNFLYDETIKVGVFSINLASESLDLNTGNQIIFYDLPWQAIKIAQAISRVVRPGNPYHKVYVSFLYYKGFIEEHQFNLYKAKAENIERILDFREESNYETQTLAEKILKEDEEK
jgi:superfamily II DNA or RNA helicase